MTETELTLEEQREMYTKNAAFAAETTMIDFNALMDAGFDDEQALRLVLAWHGKAVIQAG